MSYTDRQAPSLDDIEQHMTGKWVSEQLDRLELLVRENGSDDEMLDVIAFLRDENDRWSIPQVEEMEQAGLLTLSDDGAAHH